MAELSPPPLSLSLSLSLEHFKKNFARRKQETLKPQGSMKAWWLLVRVSAFACLERLRGHRQNIREYNRMDFQHAFLLT
jgi:hypothetical protein